MTRFLSRLHVLGFLVGVGLILLSAGAGSARQWDPDYEARIGRQAIEEIKKEYKLYDDPEQLQRIQSIVDSLKAVSPRPEVNYQIFLLDTTEENAFSLPGGYICVTKQLLAKVQSDHELAGVLAHEMAHNCTYDALEEAQKAQQVTLPVLAAVVATIVTGKSSDTVGSTYLAGMYVARSVLSTYSVQVEARADRNAVEFMVRSGRWNPVGLLTFMERLAVEERTRPPVTLGVFQTHPFSTDRVAAIADLIRAAGLDINRRAVTRWDPPVVSEGKLGEREVQVLSLWKQTILAYDYAPPGTDLAGRGAEMVKTLTAALAAGAESYEFYLEQRKEQVVVTARDQIILTLYPQDAALNGTTLEDLGKQVKMALQTALYTERLQRLYKSSPPPVATASPSPASVATTPGA